MKQNTASAYIKAQGLPNLQYVADQSNTPRLTLHRWYHGNFRRFEVVVAGVVMRDNGKIADSLPYTIARYSSLEREERISLDLTRLINLQDKYLLLEAEYGLFKQSKDKPK